MGNDLTMGAVISLLVVLTLSFLITRVATVALTLTGLSRDLARFQAVSAFTGVGFTTTEAERAVDHPVRRQVVLALMILGNAGVVTAISSVILSFTNMDGANWWYRAAWLIGGMIALWLVRSSRRLGDALDAVIHRVLTDRTGLNVIDYQRMLHIGSDYEVRTVRVQATDWLCQRSLAHAKLFQEGVLVLGIHRANGRYVGVPRGETQMRTGDILVLYGASKALAEIDERRRGPIGDGEHDEAVARTNRDRSEQQVEDERERTKR